MRPVLCIATGRACVRLLPLGDADTHGGLWATPWSASQMLDGARIHRLHAQSRTDAASSPTVFAADLGDTWKENFLLGAEALGKEDEADELLAEYEASPLGAGGMPD